VVRHDNGVRVPSPIWEKRLAVVRLRIQESKESEGGEFPHEKRSQRRELWAGPPSSFNLVANTVDFVALALSIVLAVIQHQHSYLSVLDSLQIQTLCG
jgi:hypothetical protein